MKLPVLFLVRAFLSGRTLCACPINREPENQKYSARRLPAAQQCPPAAHSIPAAGKAWRLSGTLALALLLCGHAHGGQTASLAWNPVTNSGAIGYAFYRGTTNGVYTSRFDVGTNTSITLTGLTEGQTNYFAVTSYNTMRVESAPSTQLAYIVPGVARMSAPTKPGNPATISFPVSPGHTYSVLASTDLKTWTTLYTTASATSNGWFSYQDPQTSQFPKRFYRIKLN